MIRPRRISLPALALALVLPVAVPGQEGGSPSSAASAAQEAARAIEAATLSLDAASSARDRVRALTETVRAYEAGLQAMREGLRQAAIRERTLSQSLEARQEDVARLLGALQSMNSAPVPVMMLHPDGPLGTARSGMIAAEVTPALKAEADRLAAALDEVRTLRLLQQSAADTLQEGLQGVQKARTELSQAIAGRTDLPRRFTEDPVVTAVLIASAETLDGFAQGLAEIPDGPLQGPPPSMPADKGALPLPVRGTILHGPGEADAAGIRRPGIVIATGPRAVVTTPSAATIRYRGPLLDYGNVIILEPAQDTLFVFAGLADVYGSTGEVIPAGHPVGLMGGASGDGAAGGPAGERSETLYVEVREGRRPVNPATWFGTDKDG